MHAYDKPLRLIQGSEREKSHRLDLGTVFQRMGELIGRSEEYARIQFHIRSDKESRHWCLELNPEGNRVSATRVDAPDLEIITQTNTWRQISEGSLSPLGAFVGGKLRVRGDIELGKRLFKRLTHS